MTLRASEERRLGICFNERGSRSSLRKEGKENEGTIVSKNSLNSSALLALDRGSNAAAATAAAADDDDDDWPMMDDYMSARDC